MTSPVSAPLKLTISPLTPMAAAAPTAPAFWSGEAPSFLDFLDIINPLQHIPIVSSLYQAVTDDTLSTASKLAGGALFGGPIGFVVSLFDTVIEQESGTGVTENVMAAVQGDSRWFNGRGSDHRSVNQRAAYNAYVSVQNLIA